MDNPRPEIRSFSKRGISPAHQMVILARLDEFTQYRGATQYHERDPWEYMRRKLQETEPALEGLKRELFAATRQALISELRQDPLDDERFGDFRILFERLLGPGEFADLAIHLVADGTPAEGKIQAVSTVLDIVKPSNIFVEERKPAAERAPSWERLIKELTTRLDIDRLGQILSRRPRTRRRKAFVLRRLRRNVAEYCTVLHIPTDPSQTFTPFMLPRIEGLIAANLRFLNRYR